LISCDHSWPRIELHEPPIRTLVYAQLHRSRNERPHTECNDLSIEPTSLARSLAACNRTREVARERERERERSVSGQELSTRYDACALSLSANRYPGRFRSRRFGIRWRNVGGKIGIERSAAFSHNLSHRGTMNSAANSLDDRNLSSSRSPFSSRSRAAVEHRSPSNFRPSAKLRF